MQTRILIALSVLAGLMNPVAAVIAVAEHQKDSEPVVLALFVLPWLVGAYLIHRGKVMAGAVVVGLLALLEIAAAPAWHRSTAADWASQSVAAVFVIGCFIGSVALLVERYRSARPTAERDVAGQLLT
jgi:hypothetical protein